MKASTKDEEQSDTLMFTCSLASSLIHERAV